jgi:histidyl-tRNA synthetase
MGAAALKHCGILASDILRLGLSVEVGTDHKLKRMLELANKLQARYALIVGDNEIATKSYALKFMASGEQIVVTREQLLERLSPTAPV